MKSWFIEKMKRMRRKNKKKLQRTSLTDRGSDWKFLSSKQRFWQVSRQINQVPEFSKAKQNSKKKKKSLEILRRFVEL